MYLKLDHQRLEVYMFARKIVCSCYKLTKSFPPDERFNMIQQIRRAAVSIYLNIAEGASKRSPSERKRYYAIARSSLVEIDGALDIADDSGYINKESIHELETLMVKCFKFL